MKLSKLRAFWDIPRSTLDSRKKKSPKEFKAFELGTLCLDYNISEKDLEWLAATKASNLHTEKKEKEQYIDMKRILELANSPLRFEKKHNADIYIEINKILDWFQTVGSKKNGLNISKEPTKKAKRLIALLRNEVEIDDIEKIMLDPYDIAEEMLVICWCTSYTDNR